MHVHINTQKYDKVSNKKWKCRQYSRTCKQEIINNNKYDDDDKHCSVECCTCCPLLSLVRPHHSYVVAAYCYTWSRVVCLLVGLSVSQYGWTHWDASSIRLLKTLSNATYTRQYNTRVGPRNHVLNGGGPDPSCKGAILREKWRPIVKYRDSLP